MNRIYQGKVTNVEIANPDQHAPPDKPWLPFADDPKQAKAKWQSALWQHHQLFQGAVNYYTLALAAMAGDAEGDSPAAKPLWGWVARVREIWASATREAENFDGPRRRLAPILDLAPDETHFASAANAVLRTSRATPAQRAAAVLELLAQKGDLNQVCVDRLPWLTPAAPGKRAESTCGGSQTRKGKEDNMNRIHQDRVTSVRVANGSDGGRSLRGDSSFHVTAITHCKDAVYPAAIACLPAGRSASRRWKTATSAARP